LADVFVSSPARDVVAVKKGLEQLQVSALRRIETSVAAPFHEFAFGKLPQLVVGRGWALYHRQGVQVAAVCAFETSTVTRGARWPLGDFGYGRTPQFDATSSRDGLSSTWFRASPVACPDAALSRATPRREVRSGRSTAG
jgi:hypothetical protein